MSLKGFLKLHNVITITKSIITNDGMGGSTTTSTIVTLQRAALWQNGSTNKYQYDKYAKDSSHTLCIEYGSYTFGNSSGLASNQSVYETVQFNGEEYNIVGFPDNVMNMNKILMQSLDRLS